MYNSNCPSSTLIPQPQFCIEQTKSTQGLFEKLWIRCRPGTKWDSLLSNLKEINVGEKISEDGPKLMTALEENRYSLTQDKKEEIETLDTLIMQIRGFNLVTAYLEDLKNTDVVNSHVLTTKYPKTAAEFPGKGTQPLLMEKTIKVLEKLGKKKLEDIQKNPSNVTNSSLLEQIGHYVNLLVRKLTFEMLGYEFSDVEAKEALAKRLTTTNTRFGAMLKQKAKCPLKPGHLSHTQSFD